MKIELVTYRPRLKIIMLNACYLIKEGIGMAKPIQDCKNSDLALLVSVNHMELHGESATNLSNINNNKINRCYGE